MKRRWLILLCALVLVATGALWPRGPKEPVYQGKKLSRWIKEYRDAHELEEQARAANGIRAIGTNALPFLIRELTRRDSRWVVSLKRYAARVGWNDSEDPFVRRAVAANAICLVGPKAAPVLPTLSEYFGDPELGAIAAESMRGCGELAVPYLVQALDSTNQTVRYSGIAGLLAMVSETEAAFPHLLKLLKHDDANVRRLVEANLGNRSIATKRTGKSTEPPATTNSSERLNPAALPK